MTNRHTKWVPIGLFVLWVFFTLGSFFAVQKPFSTATALAVGRTFLDILTASWLTLVAVAMGSWLLDRLHPTRLPLAETLVLGTSLGLGALGLLILGLGLVGLFQTAIAYGVTIALSLLFVPQAIRLVNRCRRWQLSNRPKLPVALYLSVIALLTVLVALLPPTDWDGLFYHLTGPKLYLQAGQVVGGIDIPHLNFPGLMEMLFTWAILLRGDIAAILLHTVFGLLLAGLVYLTARRFFSQKSAWLAVIVFASMPMVSTLAGWAYNDLALAFYQLAALYAIVHWLRDAGRITNDQRPVSTPYSLLPTPYFWLILSGIFAGLAMGMKYTSFITPLVIGGIILWYAFRQSRISGLVGLGVFAACALVIAVPWCAKNWVFTGNPVYPFLSDWFGGQFWDGFRADWYAAAGTGIGYRFSTLLALPWLLTLGIRDMNYWDGRTGPLFLLFLPLILFYAFYHYRRETGQRPVALTPLLVYGLAQFIVWTLGVIWSRSLWQSRLLLPALVALAPVVGWIWADLSRFDLPNFSLSRFANLAIGLTLVLTLVDVSFLTLQIGPVPYLVGLETRDQYLTRRLGTHYAAMQEINHELPSEAVVLFLWEPRSYYCQHDCRPDSILDEFPHQVYQNQTATAIAQAWQRLGVTHVLIHRLGLNFVLRENPGLIDTQVLQVLEQEHFKQVLDIAGAYQVYSLKATP